MTSAQDKIFFILFQTQILKELQQIWCICSCHEVGFQSRRKGGIYVGEQIHDMENF